MNIKIEREDNRFKRLLSSDATGFYTDKDGKLYLSHLKGISVISPSGGTSTYSYGELDTPVRRLVSGDQLTIEF